MDLVYSIYLLILSVHSMHGYLDEIRIEENTPIDTIIIDLKLLFEKKSLYPVEVYPSQVDAFLPFELRDHKIYLKTPLDREEICSHIDQDNTPSGQLSINTNVDTDECSKFLNIDLLNKLHDLPTTYQIKVVIIDLNDNLPIFQSINEPYLILSEDTKVGDRFMLPEAKDADSKAFSINNYRITKWLKGNQNHFFLETDYNTSKPIGYLKVVDKLDRELVDEYEFIYSAYDDNQPISMNESSKSNVKIKIKISDINDNAPEFNQPNYSIVLHENEIAKKVLEFSVIDRDADANSDVVFRFNETIMDKVFTIVSRIDYAHVNDAAKVGKLYHCSIQLIDRIDAEKYPKTFDISLIASDKGNPELSSSANITVNIININDMLPNIEFFRQGIKLVGNKMSLIENSTAERSLLALVHVSDLDSPKESIQCRIVNEFKNFYIESIQSVRIDNLPYKQYALRNRFELDREQQSVYWLKIECNDMDPERPLVRNVTLQIVVEDINDNTPKFDRETYSGYVEENEANAAVKFRPNNFIVTDDDSGENSRILFSLASYAGNETFESDFRNFDIDENSGTIFVTTPLDAEIRSEYRVMVVAQDSSVKGTKLSSNATILIFVEDKNDHHPEFRESLYKFKVEENIKVGSLIGKVEAFDKDFHETNRKIFYKISSSSDDFGYFDVDKFSGEIRTRRPIDYEKKRHIFFTVTAENDKRYSIDKSLLSEAQVQIDVINLNDNKPEFYLTNPKATILIFPLNDEQTNGDGEEFCEEVPYRVRDADYMLDGSYIDCCVVSLIEDYNKLFELRQNNLLCIRNQSPRNKTTYKISLKATDNDQINQHSSTVHFTVLFQARAKSFDKTDHRTKWVGSQRSSQTSESSNVDEYFDLSAKQTTIFIILATITILLCILLVGLVISFRRCRRLANTTESCPYNNKNIKGGRTDLVPTMTPDYPDSKNYPTTYIPGNARIDSNYQQLNHPYNNTYTIPRNVIIRKPLNNSDAYPAKTILKQYSTTSTATNRDYNNTFLFNPKNFETFNDSDYSQLMRKTRTSTPTNRPSLLTPSSPQRSLLSKNPNFKLNNLILENKPDYDKDPSQENDEDDQSQDPKHDFMGHKESHDINGLFQTSFV